MAAYPRFRANDSSPPAKGKLGAFLRVCFRARFIPSCEGQTGIVPGAVAVSMRFIPSCEGQTSIRCLAASLSIDSSLHTKGRRQCGGVFRRYARDSDSSLPTKGRHRLAAFCDAYDRFIPSYEGQTRARRSLA